MATPELGLSASEMCLIFNFIERSFYSVTVSGHQEGTPGVSAPDLGLGEPGAQGRETPREHRDRGQGEEVLEKFEGQGPEPSCLGLTLDGELTLLPGRAPCPIPGRGHDP